MLSRKKKIIILVAMVGLLVVTGYLNIALNNRVVEADAQTITTSNFYVTYRQDRQVSRETAILYYDNIISSETSSAEAKQIAEKSRQELVEAMETELVIEGLIKAKGFEDVVITATNENINVIVKGKELTLSENAQIADIITQQTGKSRDNIKIIPTE